MSIAALVISCVALAVSAGALVFTFREDRRATIRHHLERTPKLAAGVDVVQPFIKVRIWIELQSPEGIDSLQADLPDTELFEFEADIDDSRGARQRWSVALANGQRASWPAEVMDTSGGTTRAQVTCFRGKESWVVPVDLWPPYAVRYSAAPDGTE